MTTTLSECPNCAEPLHGQFCSQCGQNQKNTDRYFAILLNEAFEGIFSWNSKAWLTTVAMFLKPGFLTTEHFANRRARYISPLRLYIITSVAFFLTLSIINFLGLNNSTSSNNGSVDQKELSQLEDNQSIEAQEIVKKRTVTVNVPHLEDDVEGSVSSKLKAKIRKANEVGATNPKRLIAKIIDSMPAVTFFLLPFYALIFKLTFLNSKRYYAEHLVFTVHLNCFLFSFYTLMVIAQISLNPIFAGWLVAIFISLSNVYLAISLKRVYQQNWPVTIIKTIGVGWVYLFLTALGVVAAALIGVILL